MSHVLNPLTLPLWGSRLIEASAGTGKTWTIAALYLRLVLGHGQTDAGGRTAFGRPLVPSEILVMTFTRAATRELSDRIRSRLVEAAAVFRGEAPAQADPLLAELLADHPEGPVRDSAAWRLAMAAESMDDAAVNTIDAWCQRMLREHAFDSGCLFDEELTANEPALLAEAVQDYWRQQLYPLDGERLDAVLGVWKSVTALAADAGKLVYQPLPAHAGEGTLGEVLDRETAKHGAALSALKAGWAERAAAMKDWLDAQVAADPCQLDRKKIQARYYDPWLKALRDWATDADATLPAIKDAGLRRLTAEGMHEAVKPGAHVVLPPYFEAFGDLVAALDALQPVAVALRLHAGARIAARLDELKQQSGSFGFSDMLDRLDRALDPQRNGEAAARLRQRMLAQYPVALVDEFQDTSPVQSRIFDRLYRIADNAPDHALLLIGDPKQSIYGFRGADIQSYLTARRATAGRHYMLGTNHRSTAAVVDAVNHLLALSEQREGEGAFMYRQPAGADGSQPDNPLPFEPVQARGRDEVFVTSAGPAAAMALVIDGELATATVSRRHFAARCAEQIVTLLNDSGAGFQRGANDFVRLRPADIAILVRSRVEAAAVRRELRRRQVASVYLSDQDLVFASAEAGDLLHWLKAVASPLDARLARAALATRTASLSLAELMTLARDEEAFDARSEQLRELHLVWQTQGVLAMLRRALHLLDLPARWLGTVDPDEQGEPSEGPAPDGERRLTNVLHLAELLQVASTQLDGEQALIRWLGAQIQGKTRGGDEQIVRLESDADLVKVVTLHKSKGLEYPLVFLPFLSSFRAVEKRMTPFVNLADATGERSLQLHLTPEHLAAADRERHREDLRLLYVALTRARHAVWAGIAALKPGNGKTCIAHRSAIGYVMHGAAAVAESQLMQQAQAIAAGSDGLIAVPAEPMDTLGRTALLPRGEASALRAAQVYDASFERRWSIASFSALVRALPTSAAWASSVAAVRDDEPAGLSDTSAGTSTRPPVAAVPSAEQPWHGFPRGSVPGNFLHDQLEWLAGENFDLADSPERQQQLLRRCDRQGWGARAPEVLAWLLRVVATPLQPVGAALAELPQTRAEMEFWFPGEGLAASGIDAICRRHLLNGVPRPVLPERELRGMLMGFADLVFEHGGRYWVLDYKSNHLGASDADYADGALQSAMAAHRYDVQAALYLLALHRLLGSRLGEAYDPAQHLGGAVFFFVRGIDGPAHGCCHVPADPAMLDELDQLFRLGVEASA